MLSPAPSLRRMSSTVIRVPTTTGLPIRTAGSDVMNCVPTGYLLQRKTAQVDQARSSVLGSGFAQLTPFELLTDAMGIFMA